MEHGNSTISAPHGDEFHVYMRDWVIAITFFTILYIVSHFIIRVFTKIKDESDRVYLSVLLCTVCLAISLAALLLLPITIISNEIIYNYPNYYYTQWLHRELIFALWNKIFWSANIALFVVLPFCYFFYEAVGIRGEGLLARVYEALINLVLVFVIFAGFVYVVRGLFVMEGENVAYLPFSYSIISSVGALLVLLSTPRGFTTLTTYGMRLYLPVASRNSVEGNLYALDLEKQVNIAKGRERGYQLPSEIEILRGVEAARETFQTSNLHPIIRNILSIVITLVNLAFTGYLVLRVFIHLLRQVSIFSPIFGDPATNELADFLLLQDDAKAYRLGSFASLLQILVITYMMTSAFAGFYNLPITQRIKPKVGQMSMEMVSLNVTLVLLISSSFPVVARILEITSFDLLGDYSNTTYLRSHQFLIAYKSVFLVALTHRYVTFFNNSLHNILVNFMTPILVKFKTKFGYPNNAGLLDIHKPKND